MLFGPGAPPPPGLFSSHAGAGSSCAAPPPVPMPGSLPPSPSIELSDYSITPLSSAAPPGAVTVKLKLKGGGTLEMQEYPPEGYKPMPTKVEWKYNNGQLERWVTFKWNIDSGRRCWGWSYETTIKDPRSPMELGKLPAGIIKDPKTDEIIFYYTPPATRAAEQVVYKEYFDRVEENSDDHIVELSSGDRAILIPEEGRAIVEFKVGNQIFYGNYQAFNNSAGEKGMPIGTNGDGKVTKRTKNELESAASEWAYAKKIALEEKIEESRSHVSTALGVDAVARGAVLRVSQASAPSPPALAAAAAAVPSVRTLDDRASVPPTATPPGSAPAPVEAALRATAGGSSAQRLAPAPAVLASPPAVLSSGNMSALGAMGQLPLAQLPRASDSALSKEESQRANEFQMKKAIAKWSKNALAHRERVEKFQRKHKEKLLRRAFTQWKKDTTTKRAQLQKVSEIFERQALRNALTAWAKKAQAPVPKALVVAPVVAAAQASAPDPVVPKARVAKLPADGPGRKKRVRHDHKSKEASPVSSAVAKKEEESFVTLEFVGKSGKASLKLSVKHENYNNEMKCVVKVVESHGVFENYSDKEMNRVFSAVYPKEKEPDRRQSAEEAAKKKAKAYAYAHYNSVFLKHDRTMPPPPFIPRVLPRRKYALGEGPVAVHSAAPTAAASSREEPGRIKSKDVRELRKKEKKARQQSAAVHTSLVASGAAAAPAGSPLPVSVAAPVRPAQPAAAAAEAVVEPQQQAAPAPIVAAPPPAIVPAPVQAAAAAAAPVKHHAHAANHQPAAEKSGPRTEDFRFGKELVTVSIEHHAITQNNRECVLTITKKTKLFQNAQMTTRFVQRYTRGKEEKSKIETRVINSAYAHCKSVYDQQMRPPRPPSPFIPRVLPQLRKAAPVSESVPVRSAAPAVAASSREEPGRIKSKDVRELRKKEKRERQQSAAVPESVVPFGAAAAPAGSPPAVSVAAPVRPAQPAAAAAEAVVEPQQQAAPAAIVAAPPPAIVPVPDPAQHAQHADPAPVQQDLPAALALPAVVVPQPAIVPAPVQAAAAAAAAAAAPVNLGINEPDPELLRLEDSEKAAPVRSSYWNSALRLFGRVALHALPAVTELIINGVKILTYGNPSSAMHPPK